MEKGFIKLHRKCFSHKYWKKSRVFSEFEAWLDLIRSARFDKSEVTEYISGCEVKYGRGEYPASIRFLSARWGWGEKKVRIFLKNLLKDGSVQIDSSQGVNVISLCNYELYNPLPVVDAREDRGEMPDNGLILREIEALKVRMDSRRAAGGGHAGDTNKKKEKKEKNLKPLLNSPAGESENTDFEKFRKKLAEACPSVCKIQRQMTESEFNLLMKKYTKKEIWEIMEQMENYPRIQTKYRWVYRTALNWLKKEYGEKE